MQRFMATSWLVALAWIPRIEAKRQSTVSSMEEFWTFFIVVYALVLLPVIGYFVYSLLRDPAAPELARLVWQWLKRRTFGFLSPQYHDPSVQHKHDAARASDFQAPLVRSHSHDRAAIRKRPTALQDPR